MTIALTPTLLRNAAACSPPVADRWCEHIQSALVLAEATTPLRAAAFLAQTSHESAQFTRVRESLHYSTAERICAVWPARFRSLAEARPYVANPSALADRVYGSRMGNVQTGDGLRYCGRGLIQITGRDNYRALTAALRLRIDDAPDFDASPTLLEMPRWAALSAGAYWLHHQQLNHLADAADISGITRLINGGAIGLADRIALYKIARRSFEAKP